MARNQRPLIYTPDRHGLPLRLMTDTGRLRCVAAVPEGSGSIGFKQCKIAATGYMADTDHGLCAKHERTVEKARPQMPAERNIMERR